MTKPHLHPYLCFNGNCREAMEFYKSCMGGTVTMQTVGESPMPSKPEQKDLIMHAMMENDALSFFACDAMMGPVSNGGAVSLCVGGSDEGRLKDMFGKLSEGGKVLMKLEKQFWGDVFGMLEDKFGMQWMFNIDSTSKK